MLELETAEATSRSGDRFAADRLVLQAGLRERPHHPEWARATGNVRGILAPEGAASPRRPRKRAEESSAGTSGSTRAWSSFDDEGKPKSFTLGGSPRDAGADAEVDGAADRL